MDYLIPILLILHILPATFWLGVSGVLSNLGESGASLPLRRPQTVSAIAAMLMGSALWAKLHGLNLGGSQTTLVGGACCAVAAFLIQQSIAWPAAKNAPADFAIAQRIAGILLILALIAMVGARFT